MYQDAAERLNEDEIVESLQQLRTEQIIANRAHLWRYLFLTGPKELVRDFALQWLKDPNQRHRGYAMKYLRENFPHLMTLLSSSYQNDTDPEVRFELAQ